MRRLVALRAPCSAQASVDAKMMAVVRRLSDQIARLCNASYQGRWTERPPPASQSWPLAIAFPRQGVAHEVAPDAPRYTTINKLFPGTVYLVRTVVFA